MKTIPLTSFLVLCLAARPAIADSLSTSRNPSDPPAVYQDQNLTGIDFPIGAVGGSVIRMNGKAERRWWQIFHNYEQRQGSGVVPNSFFAIRTKSGDATRVRALQTSAVGPFPAMQSLTFSGEFPFGWYAFQDKEIPVKVTLEAYNPLIPMDLKNSAIPCAIFRIKVSNPTAAPIEVGLLATQQNAVGFSGYDTIGGENQRQNPDYGKNRNEVTVGKERTGIALTGPKGSMHLSAHTEGTTATASWQDMASLFADYEADGKLTGPAIAESPAPQTTVDAALATNFRLEPGAERFVTFVLSWHFPGGTFGRADIPQWYFVDGGNQYENWWANAAEVDAYVAEKFDYLDSTTRLYHQTLYSSKIPRYALDRMSANLSVLKSPTSFWTKAGYFGIWESTSDKQEWFGNCKHVIHYGQGHARLFPELGRLLRDIDLRSQLPEGLLSDRDGGKNDAIDGHFGTILGVYREHLLSTNTDYLKTAWPRTRKAMDYAIDRLDRDRDGMLSGSYHNTLDCNSSGTSPWIGSLYIAALKASGNMADLMGETEAANGYRELAATAIRNQNEQLWNNQLGYYVERPENLPGTRIMGDAVGIDMLLGQWWANQLGLGQLYPADRTRAGLAKIFTTNRITDPGKGYPPRYRDFLGTGDTGWQMFVHPGRVPDNTIHYFCEVMSGFEYAAAATMIQYGLTAEGMEMVKEISKRYDGRHRGRGEVTLASNATVDGSGSPFGEDECGKYYARAMSSWSVLLALQGFSFDGPQQRIGFQPVWQPEDHASFFSAANGWGLFTQNRSDGKQESAIHLKFGTLDLKSITLGIPEGMRSANARITLDGKELPHKPLTHKGSTIEINLEQPITIKAGSSLALELPLAPM
ncbi:MAG: GH116 family glycosyl-hydrolase [Verrucomicrobiales bacterium]